MLNNRACFIKVSITATHKYTSVLGRVMPVNIKSEYEKLKKQFALPSFESLDKEFEISVIERPEFLLRSVRRRIFEKFDNVLDFIEVLLQPNLSSVIDLHEYSCVSDKDRQKLFVLVQKMMVIYNRMRDANLACDEKCEANIIQEAAKKWPEIRNELRPYLQKLADCWEKSVEKEKTQGYFG